MKKVISSLLSWFFIFSVAWAGPVIHRTGVNIMPPFEIGHNTETLAGDRSILVTDKSVQYLDADGVDRNITLPAEASSTDLIFTIVNVSNGAGEDLIIRDDTPATLITIGPGQGAKVSCDGTSWKVWDDKGIKYDSVAKTLDIGTNAAGGNLVVKATEGTELVITNPSFATDLTGWTGGGDWTWDATGKAIHAATAANTFYPTVPLVIVANHTYKIVFTLSGYGAGSITMTLGGVLGTVRDADGTFTAYVTAINTNNLIFTPTAAFVGLLDDISVTEITEGTLTIEGVNTFAGRTVLESGSATWPSMVFSDDAKKVGWFRYGATSMGYATDGSVRQVFTPSTHWINSDAATLSMGTTTPDLWVTRKGAANLQIGNVDDATPVAQSLSTQSVVAGTDNTAGVNLTINGSQGTGTGDGGSILFRVAPAGGAGNAQNALETAVTIDSTKLVTFANGIVATFKELAFAADSVTLTSGNCSGTLITNRGWDGADDQTFTLPDTKTVAGAGLKFKFMAVTASGGTADTYLDVNGTETKFYLDGTALTDGHRIWIEEPAVGDSIVCHTATIDGTSYEVFCDTINGDWLAKGS
jgi:autotransporter-associated beta strand protein